MADMGRFHLGKNRRISRMDGAENIIFTGQKEHGGSPGRVYERCAVCGAVTDVPADTPISGRKCYVPGGGQLCRKCCIELYGTDDLRSLHSAELEQMFLG